MNGSRVNSGSAVRIANAGFARREILAAVAGVAILVLLFQACNRRGASAADRASCVHRLTHVGRSFFLWSADNSGDYPMRNLARETESPGSGIGTSFSLCFQVMSNELRASDVVWCPADHQRRYPTNFTTDFAREKVSYFIGWDADRRHPSALLSGDRNISTGANPVGGILDANPARAKWSRDLHGGQGNVVLVDGSVAQIGNRDLKKMLEATGFRTNRLAMP